MSLTRRDDIQCLRAIAVLSVVFYHAGLGGLRAGYLGVDVFFVISGFLITTIIIRDVDAGRFSFTEFYWRRMKRLLPASLLVFILFAYLFLLLLTPTQQAAMAAQLKGAVFFYSNIVMWKQTGYFAQAAQFAPFLHAWSLSVEEQYYFVLPFFLFICPRRARLPAIGLLLIASAGICFFFAPIKPGATFFLLPFRAWELLVGSLGAAFTFGERRTLTANILGITSLAAIAGLMFFPVDHVHPRLDAALVCLATLTLIKVPAPLLVHGRHVTVLRFIGDISYSLYLVHWPLFVALHIVFGGRPPHWLSAACVALSISLAALVFRGVENPFRLSAVRPSLWRLAAASACTFALLVPALVLARPTVDEWTSIRRVNYGLSPACDYVGPFRDNTACRTSHAPTVLVWGDSHAMHLLPGIASAASDVGVVQATRSACGPLLGAALIGGPYNFGSEWAHSCVEFNDGVLRYLQDNPQIRTVALSSKLTQYLQGGAGLLVGTRTITPATTDALVEHFTKTIRAIRSAGRAVTLVAPPPSPEFDVGECVERRARRLPFFRAGHDCSYSAGESQQKWRDVLAILEQVRAQSGVRVIYPSSTICSDDTCRATDGQTTILRDSGHFSVDGSIWYADRANLLAELMKAPL